MYRSEQQMGVVVSSIAFLSILIACMGLFGLAAISMERKVKEIGIRKVLGASVGGLVYQLTSGFTWLVFLAFILFTPLAVYGLTVWLQNFAYRIELSPLVFVAGGALGVAIAILTVGFHTIRSASANPVDTLRYE